MSETWKVQSVQRAGFAGVWRAGRLWPSDAPVIVEVLDQDKCPEVEVEDKEAKGRKRKALDPLRLGRDAWGKLVADGRISKNPIGREPGPGGDTSELQAKLRDALARVDQLAATNARLEGEALDLIERLDRANDQLEDAREQARLQWVVPPEAPASEGANTSAGAGLKLEPPKSAPVTSHEAKAEAKSEPKAEPHEPHGKRGGGGAGGRK